MTVINNLATADSKQIRKLQFKELEILKFFKEFCKDNGYQFFLAGGTCIGAIRHKGFIPWDDDVDVFMMRDQYEDFWRNWGAAGKLGKYTLCRSTESQNYHHAAMTLNDSDTTFINFRTENENVNQGIAIDILPMDWEKRGLLSRITQKISAILFSIFINQRLPDNQGKLVRFATKVPLACIRSPKHRYRVWKKAERHMISEPTDVNIELVTSLKGIFRPLNATWFKQVKWVPFEDTTMPVPEGYDEYLSLVFGDYMQMPPQEQRKAKHHTVIIDTDEPYLHYKGNKYLKGL